MKKVKKLNIIITGSSSGIGQTLRKYYEERGHKVLGISLEGDDYNLDVSNKEKLSEAFEDIAKTGKVGCADCYEIFEDRLEPIIRRIQSSNRHVGRLGKVIDQRIDEKQKNKSYS